VAGSPLTATEVVRDEYVRFFDQILSGNATTLQLHTDRRGLNERRHTAGTLDFELLMELKQECIRVGRCENVALASLLLTRWAILLAR
jgi:hypothetical protein